MGDSISFDGGTLGGGISVRHTVVYKPGHKDEGPVYFCASPGLGGVLRTNNWSKVRAANNAGGFDTLYAARIRNPGTKATRVGLEGGRLKDTFDMTPELGNPQWPGMVYTLAGSQSASGPPPPPQKIRVLVHSSSDKGARLIGGTPLFGFPIGPPEVPPGPSPEVVTGSHAKKRRIDGSTEHSAEVWAPGTAAVAFWIEGGTLTDDPNPDF
jgi:hypothetical protein